MFKRVVLLLVLSLAAAGVAVTASSTADSASKQTAGRGMLIGFYDDEQVYGRTDWAFTQLKSLRAGIVRVTLNWTAVDNVIAKAARNRMRVVLAVYGTPRWAGRAKNRLPRRITDLRLFSFAAATRYSGTYRVEVGENEAERTLPAVRFWLAWNEPNNPIFLKPQWKKVRRAWRPQSPFDYAKICSAIWAGVHSTGLANEKVACGVTGPRGNNAPRSSRPSTSPLVFLTWLRRAGLKRFDAYAHHPYYTSRLEKPTTVPKSTKAVTLGNINVLLRQLKRLYGSKRLWITEYGFQTRPPDRFFGVSYTAQAKY